MAIMPVTSATQATKLAVDYLKAYWNFAQPKSAKRVDGKWVVKIDVGPLLTRIATVEVDAQTGEVTSYEVP